MLAMTPMDAIAASRQDHALEIAVDRLPLLGIWPARDGEGRAGYVLVLPFGVDSVPGRARVALWSYPSAI